MGVSLKGYILLSLTTVFAIKTGSAQVLTSDDLVRSGVTRLSDVLELADQWLGSSTEGYHWSIAPLGLSWEASPDWSLFIDDQPINIQGLNHQSLNELPITITEICEMHLHSTPVVIGGLLAYGGAIEIRRCTPQKGLSFEGQFSAGNETGDPGPFKYTSNAVPNVDRTGPTAHSSISASSENMFIRVSAGTDEHHATDPRIRSRVLELYQGEKDARIQYRTLKLNSKVFGHQLSAGYSRVQDLMFLPLMAREIPLDKEIKYASGSYAGKRIGYALTFKSLDLLSRQNKENIQINYSKGEVYAHAYGIGSLTRNIKLNYGVTAELSRLRYRVDQEEQRLGSLRVYTLIHTNQTRNFQLKTIGALTYDSGAIGYEIFSHLGHRLSGFSMRILVRHRTVESKMNFASWVGRGFHLEGSQILDFPHGPSKHESIYSADLVWTIGHSVNLRITTGASRYLQTIKPFTKFTIEPTGERLQSVTGITFTRGNILRTSMRLHIPVSDKFGFKMSGVYVYPWLGQDSFMNAWIQRMHFGMRGEFRPNERFSIDMRLGYVGSSKWEEYEDAASKNPEFYAVELPSRVYLHLTVQKRFWGDRLRMNASMRNVLDDSHISHPAGARVNALFQVGLKYAFRMNRSR
ncbi:MAG: hypothetical protein OXE59_03050 [Bacteroidetes bacterium]|nr:hypothetical protein [Bacteroidota bacterium]MCY4232708.1 hypothetical protein [Bacteroidota bacterium]